jgi:hypothetical protein
MPGLLSSPSVPTFGVLAAGASDTGLPCAKNKILIAIARPACSAMTTISRICEVFLSVAETTG